MENSEHLKIIKQGVEVWNKWREKNPNIKPNLSRSDLRGANFSEADFERTNLSGTNLHKATLYDANLRWAILKGAKLISAHLDGALLNGADLSKADLSEASLHKVDLSKADFHKANLNRSHFSEANLHNVNLRKANLFGVIMTNVNLTGARLTKADLSNAVIRVSRLCEANLHEAILKGAKIIDVNLREVDLSKADLRETHLGHAQFIHANLTGANLEGAVVSETLFYSIDLKNSFGLEAIHHIGPSSIDIDTIYMSEGKIPEAFLRGAGVPENFIQYMGSLTGKAFEFYSCFISYSSKDHDFANRLHSDLQKANVRCWFAPEHMKGGKKIHRQIDEAIRSHDKLLLVLSETSINSDWVANEIRWTRKREKEAGKKSCSLLHSSLIPI